MILDDFLDKVTVILPYFLYVYVLPFSTIQFFNFLLQVIFPLVFPRLLFLDIPTKLLLPSLKLLQVVNSDLTIWKGTSYEREHAMPVFLSLSHSI